MTEHCDLNHAPVSYTHLDVYKRHAAGNAKLVTMLDNMREQIYRYRVEYLKDENAYPTLIQEHRKILELLDKHEKENVIEVMKVNVDKQANVVKQIIRDQE